MKDLNLEEIELSEALAGLLRRFVYFTEEWDIEDDIKTEENINQYYLLNKYSENMTEVLKSVSNWV